MSAPESPCKTDFNAQAIRNTVAERFSFVSSLMVGGIAQLMGGITTFDSAQIWHGINHLSIGKSFSKAMQDGKKELKSNKVISWEGDDGEVMVGRAIDRLIYRVAQDEIYRLCEAHDASHKPQDRQTALEAIDFVIKDATQALAKHVMVTKDNRRIKLRFKVRNDNKKGRSYQGPRLPI